MRLRPLSLYKCEVVIIENEGSTPRRMETKDVTKVLQ